MLSLYPRAAVGAPCVCVFFRGCAAGFSAPLELASDRPGMTRMLMVESVERGVGVSLV